MVLATAYGFIDRGVHSKINEREQIKRAQRQISRSTHPDYDHDSYNWSSYRYLLRSGRPFVDQFLKKMSKRETSADFTTRRLITYNPAHAKGALYDVRNAIFERSHEISRAGGDLTYQTAIKGESGGVDNRNSTMNHFMGTKILEELLAMRRVGVCIDKAKLDKNSTKLDMADQRPYLYMYRAEDIRNWEEEDGKLIRLLLRDYAYNYDQFGMPMDFKETYRFYELTDSGIKISYYDSESELYEEDLLELTNIPFAMFELSHSLLTDIIDYQIALLNIESSDLNFILKANFPFYTEQVGPGDDAAFLKDFDEEGTAENNQIVETGAMHGRKYAKNLERPGFIHPSPEPLEASMKKQAEMKKDIRRLVNLALSTIEAKHASADSKQQDEKGLEAGLAFIGQELERGEKLIAKTWSEFQGTASPATINYPRRYTLKTEEERREESKEMLDTLPKIPSITFKKEIAKQVVDTLIGHRITNELLKSIQSEIDKAKIIVTDPEVVRSDFEAGFVSTETAAIARGYPGGEDLEQAKQDHAERAKRIAEAQSSVTQGARGVDDLSADPNEAKREKEESQNPDLNDDASKGVRGDGPDN